MFSVICVSITCWCCVVQVLLRDSKSALEDFAQAAKLSPHSAHIYFNRANLHTALGHFDKAEKDYTKGTTVLVLVFFVFKPSACKLTPHSCCQGQNALHT